MEHSEDRHRIKDITRDLTEYFESREDALMAFVFGSRVRGTATDESDLDVAVYLTGGDAAASKGRDALPVASVDIETDRFFASEGEIWNNVEDRVEGEVDLVVLNRAPATLAAAVFYEGHALVVKDANAYWRFFLEITHEAEDFREFVRDFRAIKRRSASLSEVDRARIERIVDFLDDELTDTVLFDDLAKEQYLTDRSTRRNVERLVENIVNATIDIAKIVLASEHRGVPQTYRQTIQALGSVKGFDSGVTDVLSGFARLRNVLAYEYLDLRFRRIQDFLTRGPEAYASFRRQIDDWIAAQGEEENAERR